MEPDTIEKPKKPKPGTGKFILFLLCVAAFAAIIASEQATPAPAPIVPVTVTPAVQTDTSDATTNADATVAPDAADQNSFLETYNPSNQGSSDTSDDSDTSDTSGSDTTTSDVVNPDATAQCNDGTYSYDADMTTACSDNGGVENVLQ